MAILFQGDIYIKIKPDRPDLEKVEEINNDLHELTYIEAQKGISEGTERKRKELEEEKKFYSEEDESYSGTDEFFMLEITKNDLHLVTYTSYGRKNVIECDTKKLKKQYKRLVEFLSEAEYVGKEFIRTKPIYIDEIKHTDYMEPEAGEDVKILYKTPYAMLLQYKTQHRTYYEMLKPIYFLDNNYDLIGNTDKTYSDRKKMVKTVADEIETRYHQYKKYY